MENINATNGNAAYQEEGHPIAAGAIDPLFNEAFIRIFGKKESKATTRSLVNAVLEAVGVEPIGEIERISAEHGSPEGSIECKTPRFDVHVVSQARHFDIEAQRHPAELVNRAIYYAANMLVAATGKIDSYGDLPQAVVIALLDDPTPFPEAPGFVRVCRWGWDDGAAGAENPDRQLIIVVELSKVRKQYNELTEEVLSDKLLSWTYLVTQGYKKGEDMERIVATYPDIEEFAELYGLAVNDPKVMHDYWEAKTAALEYNNRQEYYAKLEREGRERGEREGRERGEREGRRIGLAEGRKEGRKEEADRIAANLRAMGLSDEDIARALA